MFWLEHHKVSERLAAQAQDASREGRRHETPDLYTRAAEAEEKALAALDTSKTRTLGISAVSAASLYYKADRLERAEGVAVRWLAFDPLPAFAKEQLRGLLQSIWTERVRESANAHFARGQVLVSVKGPEIVPGGAPLDLIVDKVKTVQSILHRTAEFLGGLEHRKRGAPSRDIQNSCRPWLFQTAPGSYQFAVAIQEEYQPSFLEPDLPRPRDVADCFLRILRVEIDDPEEGLAGIVGKADYRTTFLKLTRNLAPDGTICDRLDVSASDESSPITLDAEVRKNIGRLIRKTRRETVASANEPERLHGMLRAVHLDKDWIELTVGNDRLHVESVGEEVDDVIGPLVNRPVIVHAYVSGGKYKFLDIEPDGDA